LSRPRPLHALQHGLLSFARHARLGAQGPAAHLASFYPSRRAGFHAISTNRSSQSTRAAVWGPSPSLSDSALNDESNRPVLDCSHGGINAVPLNGVLPGPNRRVRSCNSAGTHATDTTTFHRDNDLRSTALLGPAWIILGCVHRVIRGFSFQPLKRDADHSASPCTCMAPSPAFFNAHNASLPRRRKGFN
jgi:hypothetical protein